MGSGAIRAARRGGGARDGARGDQAAALRSSNAAGRVHGGEPDGARRLELRNTPFVATHPAAEFIERGFVDDSANVAVFNGPDADVMLDDAFPRGYCFQLAKPDRERPHQVGLAFEAATHKRGRVDVEGAVWIDSTTRSLVEIVFRYVGIDRRFEKYEPGGRVSFHTMADGTPIIDRWSIRPIGTAGVVAHEHRCDIARRHARKRRRSRASAVGGWANVECATRHADRRRDTQSNPRRRSAGDARRDRVLRGERFGGTFYDRRSRARTVRRGRRRYDSCAIGDRAPNAGVVHRNARFDDEGGLRGANGGGVRGPDVLPPPPSAGRAVIVGRVLLSDGSPAVGAQIEVALVGHSGLESLSKDKTDGRGLFHICNVPVGRKIEIRAERDTKTATLSATDIHDVMHNVEALRLTLHATPRSR